MEHVLAPIQGTAGCEVAALWLEYLPPRLHFAVLVKGRRYL